MTARVAALLVVLFATPQLAAQAPACSRAPEADPLVERGWAQYRSGAIAAADSAFRSALSACATNPGAQTGLGYIALRRDSVALARRLFTRVLETQPRDYDALVGLGIAAYRAADLAASRGAFSAALGVVPEDSTSRWYLARIAESVGQTAADLPVPIPRARPASTVIAARARQRAFEVPDGRGGWTPLWVAGVNLGAALPGKHPSDFPPNDSTYERWIRLFADMRANVIRVYTIHPPHFYRALRDWNAAHPERPIWLIHGVWTELPPGRHEERYDDPAWNTAFRAETRRVVDLLHGSAAIPKRPGHAGGFYDADVSPWVLAYIIGREWEPYSVTEYAKRNPRRRNYTGRYVRVAGGNAVDVWLGAALDYLAAYEMDTYNAQRPMAYTNWPTLDPLTHVTESTKEEEARLRRRPGEAPDTTVREYDNDAIALDARVMQPTAAFAAGLFASYHAYPYYPDFMVLDPAYNRAVSPEGPSTYYGYLRELVAYHGDMPLLVSEYGVPSSRGMAHRQPQGWNHGGHDERAQADINARLTRDIHAAGAAGAVLFAAIDEWFKKNWLVIEFEVPAERNRLWLNPLDAEQNYGVVAMRPGTRDSAILIDGRSADWKNAVPLMRDAAATDSFAINAFYVRSDEAYVYLRLDADRLDWRRRQYLVGIDTYRRDLGDRRFPYTGAAAPVGFEFMLQLRGADDGRLLVDKAYNLYRRVDSSVTLNRPLRTIPNEDGRYDSMFVTSNRRRIGRDGTAYPAYRYDRGRLVHSRQQETTLADWYADTTSGVIEVRLPWGLLHVLDPSSRSVLYGDARSGNVAGVPSDGFRFVVESFDPADPVASRRRLPDGEPPAWTWSPWETPRWYPEIKPAFASMRDTFAALLAAPHPSAGAAAYRNGKRADRPREPKR